VLEFFRVFGMANAVLRQTLSEKMMKILFDDSDRFISNRIFKNIRSPGYHLEM